MPNPGIGLTTLGTYNLYTADIPSHPKTLFTSYVDDNAFSTHWEPSETFKIPSGAPNKIALITSTLTPPK